MGAYRTAVRVSLIFAAIALAPGCLPQAIDLYYFGNAPLLMVRGLSVTADLAGTPLNDARGAGWSVEYVWAREPGGPELWGGGTWHEGAPGAANVRAYFLRLGYRTTIPEGEPLFVYGSAGLSLDVVDSADFEVLVGLLPGGQHAFPFGVYARIGAGLRGGHSVLTFEGMAVLAAVYHSEDGGSSQHSHALTIWGLALGVGYEW